MAVAYIYIRTQMTSRSSLAATRVFLNVLQRRKNNGTPACKECRKSMHRLVHILPNFASSISGKHLYRFIYYSYSAATSAVIHTETLILLRFLTQANNVYTDLRVLQQPSSYSPSPVSCNFISIVRNEGELAEKFTDTSRRGCESSKHFKGNWIQVISRRYIWMPRIKKCTTQTQLSYELVLISGHGSERCLREDERLDCFSDWQQVVERRAVLNRRPEYGGGHVVMITWQGQTSEVDAWLIFVHRVENYLQQ